MKIHDIQPHHPLKSRKRIGRGGKRGTYSGKGMKGQRARSGASITPLFAGGAPTLTGQGSKVVHKMRGQHNGSTSDIHFTLNIDQLDSKFADGDTISVDTLREKGLIKRKHKQVKILARGTSKKRFVFQNVDCSQSVRDQYAK